MQKTQKHRNTDTNTALALTCLRGDQKGLSGTEQSAQHLGPPRQGQEAPPVSLDHRLRRAIPVRKRA